MIGEKKIKEAAIDNADKYKPTTSELDNEESCRASFIDGAKWAQQEFIKTLWHAPVIEPKRGKDIIAISKKGESYTFHYHALSAIQKSFHDCNIERWAYLSDILPKEVK